MPKLLKCRNICRPEAMTPSERTNFFSRGSKNEIATPPASVIAANTKNAVRQLAASATMPAMKRPLKPPRLAPDV